MTTVMIPCCGSCMHHNIPVWLSRHPNGTPLIVECIQDLSAFEMNRIIITILEEDDASYNEQAVLRTFLKDIDPTPEILVLKERTSGPAETIFRTITEKHIRGNIIIHDADVKLRVGGTACKDFIVGVDLMACKQELPNLRNKAFLKINENNVILDILEKQISSNNVCLGIYGISSAEDFLNAYMALRDVNYETDSLFVSNIIAYLIGLQNHVFHYIETSYFEDWDSSGCMKRLHAAYGTYFINYDKLDIQMEAQKLKQFGAAGANMIFYSSGPEAAKGEVLEAIKKYEIRNSIVIMGCTSEVCALIDSSDQLEKYFREMI